MRKKRHLDFGHPGFLSVAVLFAGSGLRAADPATLDIPLPPISPEEPFARGLSLERAAGYLDAAALAWQKEKKCGTCHTNFVHLIARPALARVSPPPPEVRAFFEDMVAVRWEKEGPRWDAEVVCAAVTLAWSDRAAGRGLHALTRKALDRMCSLQREDGGWGWLLCGWPPMESDDHYGVTFAAIGLAAAPDDYAKSEKGARALDGIRRYLKAHPAPSLHHRMMVLWAGSRVEGILDDAGRARILEELFAAQRPDGGWAIAVLLYGWKEHRRQDDEPQDLTSSDGYATGFAIYAARAAGVPPKDPRIARGIRWLEENQRESGRWFTRSPTKNSKHYISNAGTAFAVMAIEACR